MYKTEINQLLNTKHVEQISKIINTFEDEELKTVHLANLHRNFPEKFPDPNK